jgi:hypothetical protein
MRQVIVGVVEGNVVHNWLNIKYKCVFPSTFYQLALTPS